MLTPHVQQQGGLSYPQLVARTSSLLIDHDDLKGIITAAKAGDMLAVLDRNELEGE